MASATLSSSLFSTFILIFLPEITLYRTRFSSSRLRNCRAFMAHPGQERQQLWTCSGGYTGCEHMDRTGSGTRVREWARESGRVRWGHSVQDTEMVLVLTFDSWTGPPPLSESPSPPFRSFSFLFFSF